MVVFQERLVVQAQRQGLHEITEAVADVVRRGGCTTGLCSVFVHHTSCSLVIQENADPSARHDLETWLARLAPEGDPAYTHTAEGPDDMPAHLRSAVTRTSEQVPITEGRLGLGTWQGIYLWEHRRRGGRRTVTVMVVGS
jgi:secondary thiamine-phosphate synthase enzyme